MAQQANDNNNQFILNREDNIQVVIEALKDYGLPIGRVLQMARAWATSADYLMDVQLFLDNYNRFQELQNAASSVNINLVEDLAHNQLQTLLKKIDTNDRWSFLCSILPDGDECATSPEMEQMNELQTQIKQLNEFKKKWHNVFSSTEAIQSKADEILSRNKWMKIVELAMVFKDVCIGINRVKQVNKKIQRHKQELSRINADYIKPTMQSFEQNGTIDNTKVQIALMQLRYIKTQCEVEQKESAHSFFGNIANAVSMGFQAYASFTNASALADIASKAMINSTLIIGSAQATLSVGSLVLTGVEAYNYIQYQNIIDDVQRITEKLEYYNAQLKRLQ